MTDDDGALPEDATIAHQFRLDAPRIAFYADDHRLDSARTDVLWAYAGKWASAHGCDPRRIRHWCTQTALAPSYTRAAQALQRCRGAPVAMHLVDDGQQSIVFHTQAGRLQLRKPFRIVQTTDRHLYPRVVQRLCLLVTVDHTGATYDWCEATDSATAADSEAVWGTTVAGLLVAWTALSWL